MADEWFMTIGAQRWSVAYEPGAIVFHRARKESLKGIITELRLCSDGGILYGVAWGDNTSTICYACELSATFLPEWAATDD